MRLRRTTMRLLTLVGGICLVLFAPDLASAGKPEGYVVPKGAVTLTVDKAPAGEPHRALATAARLHPKDKNLLIGATANGEVVLWQIDTRALKWRKKVFEPAGVRL